MLQEVLESMDFSNLEDIKAETRDLVVKAFDVGFEVLCVFLRFVLQ